MGAGRTRQRGGDDGGVTCWHSWGPSGVSLNPADRELLLTARVAGPDRAVRLIATHLDGKPGGRESDGHRRWSIEQGRSWHVPVDNLNSHPVQR